MRRGLYGDVPRGTFKSGVKDLRVVRAFHVEHREAAADWRQARETDTRPGSSPVHPVRLVPGASPSRVREDGVFSYEQQRPLHLAAVPSAGSCRSEQLESANQSEDYGDGREREEKPPLSAIEAPERDQQRDEADRARHPVSPYPRSDAGRCAAITWLHLTNAATTPTPDESDAAGHHASRRRTRRFGAGGRLLSGHGGPPSDEGADHWACRQGTLLTTGGSFHVER